MSPPITQMNYGYLLGGLLVLLLGSAIANEEGALEVAGSLLIEPAFCLMLLLGVWGLKDEKKWYVAGKLIVMIAIICSTILLFWETPGSETRKHGNCVDVLSGQHNHCFSTFGPNWTG